MSSGRDSSGRDSSNPEGEGPDDDRQPARRRDLRREMSITHDDFLRTLRRLIEAHSLTIEGAVARIDDAEGTITIRLAPETTRQIGSLSLPSVTVDFRFESMREADVDDFLQRFDTHFRRGGG